LGIYFSKLENDEWHSSREIVDFSNPCCSKIREGKQLRNSNCFLQINEKSKRLVYCEPLVIKAIIEMNSHTSLHAPWIFF